MASHVPKAKKLLNEHAIIVRLQSIARGTNGSGANFSSTSRNRAESGKHAHNHPSALEVCHPAPAPSWRPTRRLHTVATSNRAPPKSTRRRLFVHPEDGCAGSFKAYQILIKPITVKGTWPMKDLGTHVSRCTSTPLQHRMLTSSSQHGRRRTPRTWRRIRDQLRRQYSHNLATCHVPVKESRLTGVSTPASTSLHHRSRRPHEPRSARPWFPPARIKAFPSQKMQRQIRELIFAQRCPPTCHRAVERLSGWGGIYLSRLMPDDLEFSTVYGLDVRSCNPARLMQRFHLTPDPPIRCHDDGLVRRR